MGDGGGNYNHPRSGAGGCIAPFRNEKDGMVEAAGVEPASEIVVSQETPCSVAFEGFASDA